jgi:hypothetical protein
VDRLLRPTRFAFDFAAPVEGAGTSLEHDHLLRSISSSAAHQVATIDAYRCVVALTAMRAQDAQAQIFLTKSG